MLIIKNAIAVLENSIEKTDIAIKNEKIFKIKKTINATVNDTVINAEGKYIIPGAIDAHTHFDMPCGDIKTSDDFYSGSMAAIRGGTTSIIDFCEPKLGQTLNSGLDEWNIKVKKGCFTDYAFHMTVSSFTKTTNEEIKDICKKGITSFKTYRAYKDDIGVNDKELYMIMKAVKENNGILLCHCENGDILELRQDLLAQENKCNIYNHCLSRPVEVEHDAVSGLIDIATLTGSKIYIVHCSTKEAIKEIKEAKLKELEVYGETCPQYLILDEEKYKLNYKESIKYVCSPPLRHKDNLNALWNGIQDGIIDTISTDHCSFNCYDKLKRWNGDFRKILNGLPGVENRVELIISEGLKKQIKLLDIIKKLSLNPAKIFGMYPKKGVLREGSDADIVVIDLNTKKTIRRTTNIMNVDYSPYEGISVNASVTNVFLRGKHIVLNGNIISKPMGKYIFRK